MQFTKSFLKKSIGTNNRGQYYDNVGINNTRNNNIGINNIETNNETNFLTTNVYLEQSHKEKELTDDITNGKILLENFFALTKPGDYIAAGSPLMTLHTDEPARFERALDILDGAVIIVEGGTVNRLPLVLERIEG